MRHDFSDGKYTVINDNGKLTALRHGEPWGRDLTGDNLIYWMLVEVDNLKQQRDALLKDAHDLLEYCDESDGAQYGTISTRFIRTLFKDSIVKATGEQP